MTTDPAKTPAVDDACDVMDRAIQRIAELEAQLRHYKEKFTTDYDLTKLSDQIRDLQAQLRQEREANAEFRPDKYSLSNSEVESTGTLCGGAIANIARELLARRGQVARLQTTISQLREKLKDVLDWVKVSVYDGDHLPPAGGVYCRGRAALAQKPEEEAKP